MKPTPLICAGFSALLLLVAAACAADGANPTNASGKSTSSTPAAPAASGSSSSKGTFKDNFKAYEAKVDMPFEGETTEVLVKFTGFGANVRAKAGISALQIKDWKNAVVEFQQAVVAKPNSWQYHFALGVSAEAAGDYVLARKEYVEANRIKGGDGHFDSQAGLKRLNAREGK